MSLVCGCSALPFSGVTGSGVVKTEERVVDEFDGISVDCVGEVSIIVGKPQSMEISFDDNLVEIVETQVVDRELSIRTNKSFQSKNGLKITISVPTLERVGLSSVGSTTISEMSGEKLRLDISGVGSCTASGQVGTLDLTLSGVGSAELKDLVANSAFVKVSGVGSATVHATESIDAKCSGVGGITIHGNPAKVTEKSSGMGKISVK